MPLKNNAHLNDVPPILKFGFHKHMMLNLTLEKRFWLGATPQKSIIMQMSFLEGI